MQANVADAFAEAREDEALVALVAREVASRPESGGRIGF